MTDDGYRPLSIQQNVPLGNTTTPLTITLEKNMDWGFVTLIGVGILVLLILYAVIRLFVRRSRHHTTKRNEI